MRVLIINYGVGNLFSLKNAFERLNCEVLIKDELKDDTDAIILPGVGSFDPAIIRLSKFKDKLMEEITKGKPCFGICLGMQLFFNESEEGIEKGLNLLKGKVVRLPKGLKVPQMGWNTLKILKYSSMFDGIEDNSWVYFAHSYHPETSKDYVITKTNYGVNFPSTIQHGNLFGTQYHPEKSGKVGLKILENFVRFCKK
ncbi:MAG: imidazole glycerol phosphate synthase subunit HisH [Nitrososphaerales archaeon]